MPDYFQMLGRLVSQSLSGQAWKSAQVELKIVDVGVVDAQATYEPRGEGPVVGFDFADPVGVAQAVGDLRKSMIGQGHPPWRALTLRLERSGAFKVEYSY